MNCNSTNWKDIIKVTAYPDSAVSFTYPMNVEKICVTPGTDYTINTNGGEILPKGAYILSISDMDASLKDDYKMSIAGTAHTVKLEYKMLCDGNNLDKYKTEIEALSKPRENYHLIVEYISGNKHFVRSTPDSYLFDWNVDSAGTTSCSITIHNVSGPQKIQS